MAITFPINPLHDQQYTPPGIPVTWQFDVGRNAWRVLRVGAAWGEIVGKPSTFPPSAHQHPIADVTSLQGVLDGKQDISARAVPNGYPSLDEMAKVPMNQLPDGIFSGDWFDISNKPSEFPPSQHSHPVAEISDSGTTGQQIVRAPTPADARNIIGAIGVDDNARVGVKKNDILLGTRRAINFHEGTNVTLSVVDDVASEEVDVTINSSGGSGGGAAYTVSETKPAAPFANDLWLDVATGILFTYYNDGDTSQWIEALPYLETMPGAFTKFNFPTAPINDQVFEPIPGAKWKWSSTRGVWFAVGSAGATGGSYTKAEADAKFVDNAGDAMTGPLSIVPPTADTHAATKLYVDSRAQLVVSDIPPASPIDGTLWWESDSGVLYVRYNDGVGASQWVQAVALPAIDTSQFVMRSGDTMTGPLTLAANPASALQAAPKQYVDAFAAPLDAMAYNGMQVNGSMEVSQERGTTSTAVNFAYACDSWRMIFSGTMAPFSGQSGVFAPGFPAYVYLANGTAQPSLGAGDYAILMHNIEGYRVSRLAWGSSSARPITIAFWSSNTPAGVYGGVVRNTASTRAYAFTYTQSIANTPEYRTITIPGDTTGTWEVTNASGLTLIFAQAAGTTNTAPSVNTWLAGSYLAAPGTINGVTASSQAIRITGVCVLPGIYAPTAAQSPLIMRPYDQELMTCQRYYERGLYGVRFPAAGASAILSAPLGWKITKRAVPTTAVSGTGTRANAAGFTVSTASLDGAVLQLVSTAAGDCYALNEAIVADARL